MLFCFILGFFVSGNSRLSNLYQMYKQKEVIFLTLYTVDGYDAQIAASLLHRRCLCALTIFMSLFWTYSTALHLSHDGVPNLGVVFWWGLRRSKKRETTSVIHKLTGDALNPTVIHENTVRFCSLYRLMRDRTCFWFQFGHWAADSSSLDVYKKPVLYSSNKYIFLQFRGKSVGGEGHIKALQKVLHP